MGISFACENCGRPYHVQDHLSGRRIRCKDCGEMTTVPLSSRQTGVEEPATAKGSTGAKPPQWPAARPAAAPPASVAGTGRRAAANQTWEEDALPAPTPADLRAQRMRESMRRIAWKLLIVALLVVALLNYATLKKGYDRLAAWFGWTNPTLGTWADVQAIPLPTMPLLGVGQTLDQMPGVILNQVRLAAGDLPGHTMQMRVYRPVGEHPRKSLPCIVAGAVGRSGLTGSNLGPEHEPFATYARKGFVVLAYSTDGPLAGDLKRISDEQIAKATAQFLAAKAGLVNARNAIEYALTRLPEVDGNRLYSAGEGAGGNLALLLASMDPRIRGCVAFAPICDPANAQAEDLKRIERKVNGVREFLAEASSKNRLSQVSCPVYIFQAEDDDTVPIADSRTIVDLLRSAGKPAEMDTVASGGHDEAIARQGIRRAVIWLKNLPGRKFHLAGNDGRPDEDVYQDPPKTGLWALDPAALSELQEEIAVGMYRLRPPRGMVLMLSSAESSSHLQWSAAGTGASGAATFTVRLLPRRDPKQKQPGTITGRVPPISATDLYTLMGPNGSVECGMIGRIPFTRVSWIQEDENNPDQYVRHIVLAGLVGQQWLEISGQWPESDETAGRTMEMAARSLRASEPLDPPADPLAPQRIAPRLVDDPEHATAILVRCGVEAQAAVIPMLKHADAAVRRSAAEVLREIASDAAAPALREAARDRDAGVAAAARAALRRIDSGFDAVGEAIFDLSSGDAQARLRALETLGGAKADARSAQIAGKLKELALGDDQAVREAAIQALLVWKTEQTGPELALLLDPESDEARRHRAIDALVQLRDPRTLASAIRCVGRDPYAVRLLAVLGTEAEVAGLLRHESAAVRAAAAQVLGDSGSVQSLQALAEAAKDPQASVAGAAESALAGIRKRVRQTNPTLSASEPLLREVLAAPAPDPNVLAQLSDPVDVSGYTIRPPKRFKAKLASSQCEWFRLDDDQKLIASLMISVSARRDMSLSEPMVITDGRPAGTSSAVYAKNGVTDYIVINGWKMLCVRQDQSTPTHKGRRVVYTAFDGERMIEVTVIWVDVEPEAVYTILETAAQTLRRPGNGN